MGSDDDEAKLCHETGADCFALACIDEGTNLLVGYAVLRRITHAHRLLPPSDDARETAAAEFVDVAAPQPAVLSVECVWVAAPVRRRHIATRLLDVARRGMKNNSDRMRIDGTAAPSRDKVAFSPPTADAKALAEAYTKRRDFLVHL